MNVVVDSSGWYAYFVNQDIFHDSAHAFIETKPVLWGSNVVFEEVVALIHKRFNKQVALKVIDTMHKMCEDNVRYITKTDDLEILETYGKTNQTIDYVDASVIWLARKFDLPIFTFDSHFKKLKLTIVP